MDTGKFPFPSQNVPVFNVTDFPQDFSASSSNIDYSGKLNFPTAQGKETFTNLSVSGNFVTNTLTFPTGTQQGLFNLNVSSISNIANLNILKATSGSLTQLTGNASYTFTNLVDSSLNNYTISTLQMNGFINTPPSAGYILASPLQWVLPSSTASTYFIAYVNSTNGAIAFPSGATSFSMIVYGAGGSAGTPNKSGTVLTAGGSGGSGGCAMSSKLPCTPYYTYIFSTSGSLKSIQIKNNNNIIVTLLGGGDGSNATTSATGVGGISGTVTLTAGAPFFCIGGSYGIGGLAGTTIANQVQQTNVLSLNSPYASYSYGGALTNVTLTGYTPLLAGIGGIYITCSYD